MWVDTPMVQAHLSPQRIVGRLVFAGLVLLSLGACSPGGIFSGDMMYAPHRAQVVDDAVLRSALTALIEGDMAGQIVLSEEEFTSLLRMVLVNDTDEESVIRDVTVWFEPDIVYIKIMLSPGTIPGISTETALNLEGGLTARDGRLRFELSRAGVGVLPFLSVGLLILAQSELRTALQILDRATVLDISVDSGSITIDVP